MKKLLCICLLLLTLTTKTAKTQNIEMRSPDWINKDSICSFDRFLVPLEMFSGTPVVSNLFDVIAPEEGVSEEMFATLDELMDFIKEYGLQNLQRGRANFFMLKTANGYMIVSVTRTENDDFDIHPEDGDTFLKQFPVPFFSAFKPRKTRET